MEQDLYLDIYFDDFGYPLPEGFQIRFEVERDSIEVTLTDRIQYKEAEASH